MEFDLLVVIEGGINSPMWRVKVLRNSKIKQ